jgi:hypothetical protein
LSRSGAQGSTLQQTSYARIEGRNVTGKPALHRVRVCRCRHFSGEEAAGSVRLTRKGSTRQPIVSICKA